MEDKILYNTLKAIGTGKEHDTAPDKEYLKAMETLGLVKLGWDNFRTDFGDDILDHLRGKFERW